jgi:hypothetical protein
LAKANVPWDIIMDLDDEVRRGMVVAAGIVEGGVFDWDAQRWRKPNA